MTTINKGFNFVYLFLKCAPNYTFCACTSYNVVNQENNLLN